VEEAVLASLRQAGFEHVRVVARESSWFGPLAHYQGKRGSGSAA
jgi:hypothetical protein